LPNDPPTDDRGTDDEPDRPHLKYGLAAEVWHADDAATALARWCDQRHGDDK
jgi:hypothetical protein